MANNTNDASSTQVNPEEQRERFRDWLNNEGMLTQYTITQYVSQVNQKKCFEISDVEVAKKCLDALKKENNPHQSAVKKYIQFLEEKTTSSASNNSDVSSPEFARNRILFGAPGTGKSHTLNKEKDKLLENGGEYERVTFHPDYSYANFVGTYKPVMATRQLDEDIQPVISVLTDQTKSAQEKYDFLYDKFKEKEGVTRLEALVGLYSGGNETFETRNSDESRTYQNLGKAIRKYVKLFTEQEKSNDIAYEYVPGPFMRVYVKARKNSNKPFLLIIEEINRANVAAVFGDVFQLLDRDADGKSVYPIEASEDIKNYLAKELGGKAEDYSEIRIPNNMFIWATMNSADQGVFPMDTAFKRRWDFTYIGIDGIDDNNDNKDEDIRDKYVSLGKDANQKIKWNALRKAINNFLAKENINEDKQLGPYFISIVIKNGDEIDRDKFIDAFKNKVIMYLFEDAARQKRSTLFAGCSECSNRYSEICQKFDDIGIDIFNQEIRDETKSTKPEPSDLNQTNVDSNE